MPTVRAVIEALKQSDPDATAVLNEDAFTGAGEFVALDSLLSEIDDADEPASERELHAEDEGDGEDALDHADSLADDERPRMVRAGGGYGEDDEEDCW